jgi:hypothetical protein
MEARYDMVTAGAGIPIAEGGPESALTLFVPRESAIRCRIR